VVFPLEGEAFIYARSLMANHFHLLLRIGERHLSSRMRRLLSVYVDDFNCRRNPPVVYFRIGTNPLFVKMALTIRN